MTKVFMVFFGLMTVGAIYMTAFDVGVMDPSITKHSVRQGSTHIYGSRMGSYRGGK